MKKFKVGLILKCLFVLGFNLSALQPIYAQSSQSVTKVGNGNDGSDLEKLSPLTTGPIAEARMKALKLLDKLNIVGVPGLGMLIPEVEKTKLLMAEKNVYPNGEQKGSLEISEDQKVVYARTFATPSADTRFFPAAKKLNSDQLIALHIHEALHRALPERIRENENVVMHFTLAITSPGASFDRIYQVSNMYLKPDTQQADLSNLKMPEPHVMLPTPSNTSLKYQFDTYSNNKDEITDPNYIVHGIEYNSSLGGYSSIFGRAVEPTFRARIKILKGYDEKMDIGPLSADFEARVAIENGVAGPFLRYTTASESVFGMAQREVLTIGGFYRSQSDSSYINSTLGYSLPSRGQTSDPAGSDLYKSIISLNSQFGIKWTTTQLGIIAEVHSSGGMDTSTSYQGTSAFNLIILGPEISYSVQNFEIKTYFKSIINAKYYSMSDLADIMDRGYGFGGFGATLSYGW